jgi:hypothetical protein
MPGFIKPQLATLKARCWPVSIPKAFSGSLESFPLAPWPWFETREDALLTMRVRDLILRRREAPSRRMKAFNWRLFEALFKMAPVSKQ